MIYLPAIGTLFEKTRKISSVIVYRVALPLTIGAGFLVLWVNMHTGGNYGKIFGVALRDWASIQDYFSILGNLYAICIAFLLFKGLTDYDNLRGVLRDESDTIRAINDFMYYLSDRKENKVIIDRVKFAFNKYIENIFENKKITKIKENENYLKYCIVQISNFKINDENDAIALNEIMTLVGRLTHIRAKRSSHMENRMSPLMLGVLMIISVAILMPFMLRSPNESYVLHLLIFSLATFFSFLFLTLMDIDSPFDGYWEIKVDSFEQTKNYLKNDGIEEVKKIASKIEADLKKQRDKA